MIDINNKMAALCCWLLKEQFSPLDLLYAIFVGLAYRDFGFFSFEVFMMLIFILSFHFIFRKATASMRLAYLLRKVEKFCKINGIK